MKTRFLYKLNSTTSFIYYTNKTNVEATAMKNITIFSNKTHWNATYVSVNPFWLLFVTSWMGTVYLTLNYKKNVTNIKHESSENENVYNYNIFSQYILKKTSKYIVKSIFACHTYINKKMKNMLRRTWIKNNNRCLFILYGCTWLKWHWYTISLQINVWGERKPDSLYGPALLVNIMWEKIDCSPRG